MSTERAYRIEQIASEWLAKRDSGHWTESDQRAFEQWRDESTLHRVAYLSIERAWEQSLRLKALGAGVPLESPPPPGHWNLTPFLAQPASQTSASDASSGAATLPHARSHRVVRFFRLAALAATLAVALVGGAFVMQSTFFGGTYHSTPTGGVSSVPLPDGSKLTLNTDSEVRVAVTESERRIDLERGEAFCEVAQDSKRPFVVRVGQARVVALGTKFAVRRDKDDIRIVVTEGAVRVDLDSAPGNIRSQRLAAGTVARAGEGGLLSVQRKNPAEAEEQLSWRRGILIFHDTTLGEAVAEFNRYNEHKAWIKDAEVADMHVAGSFRSTSIDAFVRLLEQGYPIHAERYDDRIVLTRSEPALK